MPTKKKNNLPIPFFQAKKGIAIIHEKYIEIGLNPQEKEQDQYLQDHLLQLEEEIKSLAHAKEQIAHLKAFRDYLSGPCKIKGKTITIIQCSALWKKNKCNFKKCEIRKKWESLFL